jgi:hypothetical protein
MIIGYTNDYVLLASLSSPAAAGSGVIATWAGKIPEYAGISYAADLILRGDSRPKVEQYEVNVRWTFGKKAIPDCHWQSSF